MSAPGGRSFSRKDSGVDERDADSGYVRVLLKPLERGSYSVVLGWLGAASSNRRGADAVAVGVVTLLTSFAVYQIVAVDVGQLFRRLCGVVEPILTIMAAFYWLALYLRKTWSPTSVYLLFCSCFVGEIVGQVMCRQTADDGYFVTQPFLALVVLAAVGVSSVFSTLETPHSVLVIAVVSVVRLVACCSLVDLPQVTRPYVAYVGGVIGTLAARYVEAAFNPTTVDVRSDPDGRIPIIKRRRSSASTSHGFTSHRAGRRTSLPALIQKSQVRVLLIIWYVT